MTRAGRPVRRQVWFWASLGVAWVPLLVLYVIDGNGWSIGAAVLGLVLVAVRLHDLLVRQPRRQSGRRG